MAKGNQMMKSSGLAVSRRREGIARLPSFIGISLEMLCETLKRNCLSRYNALIPDSSEFEDEYVRHIAHRVSYLHSIIT